MYHIKLESKKQIIYALFSLGNQCWVLLAIFTSINITGTSVRTPTIVAKATPGFNGNKAIATATASSKKFEAPIKPAGADMVNGSFAIRHDP